MGLDSKCGFCYPIQHSCRLCYTPHKACDGSCFHLPKIHSLPLPYWKRTCSWIGHLEIPQMVTLITACSTEFLLKVYFEQIIYSGLKQKAILKGIHAKLLQSCPILCDPMDCSLPGYSVHGVLQAKILEWVAIPSPWRLPDPGIKLASPEAPALQADFLLLSYQGSH